MFVLQVNFKHTSMWMVAWSFIIYVLQANLAGTWKCTLIVVLCAIFLIEIQAHFHVYLYPT